EERELQRLQNELRTVTERWTQEATTSGELRLQLRLAEEKAAVLKGGVEVSGAAVTAQMVCLAEAAQQSQADARNALRQVDGYAQLSRDMAERLHEAICQLNEHKKWQAQQNAEGSELPKGAQVAALKESLKASQLDLQRSERLRARMEEEYSIALTQMEAQKDELECQVERLTKELSASQEELSAIHQAREEMPARRDASKAAAAARHALGGRRQMQPQLKPKHAVTSSWKALAQQLSHEWLEEARDAIQEAFHGADGEMLAKAARNCFMAISVSQPQAHKENAQQGLAAVGRVRRVLANSGVPTAEIDVAIRARRPRSKLMTFSEFIAFALELFVRQHTGKQPEAAVEAITRQLEAAQGDAGAQDPCRSPVSPRHRAVGVAGAAGEVLQRNSRIIGRVMLHYLVASGAARLLKLGGLMVMCNHFDLVPQLASRDLVKRIYWQVVYQDTGIAIDEISSVERHEKADEGRGLDFEGFCSWIALLA
ncbi:unnamed protein product, partial [Chrysoparadoxa australica]